MPIDRDDYKDAEMLSCLAKDCYAYWCKKCSQLAERSVKHSCDGTEEFKDYVKREKVRECPGKATISPLPMICIILIVMERMWRINSERPRLPPYDLHDCGMQYVRKTLSTFPI
jgi:hypothetical protein